jgi:hypothetical protein
VEGEWDYHDRVAESFGESLVQIRAPPPPKLQWRGEISIFRVGGS